MNDQEKFPKDLLRITAICSALSDIYDNEKKNRVFLKGDFKTINEEVFLICCKYINDLSKALISLHEEKVKENRAKFLQQQKIIFEQVQKPFLKEALRQIQSEIYKKYNPKDKDS